MLLQVARFHSLYAGYVCIHQWMSEQRKCVCVYDNLGCFCGLAVVSNTAVNMECISF